ncbi:MAG: hypothetical protein ACTSUE_18770 [Promethearchaeota archaeon]
MLRFFYTVNDYLNNIVENIANQENVYKDQVIIFVGEQKYDKKYGEIDMKDFLSTSKGKMNVKIQKFDKDTMKKDKILYDKDTVKIIICVTTKTATSYKDKTCIFIQRENGTVKDVKSKMIELQISELSLDLTKLFITRGGEGKKVELNNAQNMNDVNLKNSDILEIFMRNIYGGIYSKIGSSEMEINVLDEYMKEIGEAIDRGNSDEIRDVVANWTPLLQESGHVFTISDDDEIGLKNQVFAFHPVKKGEEKSFFKNHTVIGVRDTIGKPIGGCICVKHGKKTDVLNGVHIGPPLGGRGRGGRGRGGRGWRRAGFLGGLGVLGGMGLSALMGYAYDPMYYYGDEYYGWGGGPWYYYGGPWYYRIGSYGRRHWRRAQRRGRGWGGSLGRRAQAYRGRGRRQWRPRGTPVGRGRGRGRGRGGGGGRGRPRSRSRGRRMSIRVPRGRSRSRGGGRRRSRSRSRGRGGGRGVGESIESGQMKEENWIQSSLQLYGFTVREEKKKDEDSLLLSYDFPESEKLTDNEVVPSSIGDSIGIRGEGKTYSITYDPAKDTIGNIKIYLSRKIGVLPETIELSHWAEPLLFDELTMIDYQKSKRINLKGDVLTFKVIEKGEKRKGFPRNLELSGDYDWYTGVVKLNKRDGHEKLIKEILMKLEVAGLRLHRPRKLTGNEDVPPSIGNSINIRGIRGDRKSYEIQYDPVKDTIGDMKIILSRIIGVLPETIEFSHWAEPLLFDELTMNDYQKARTINLEGDVLTFKVIKKGEARAGLPRNLELSGDYDWYTGVQKLNMRDHKRLITEILMKLDLERPRLKLERPRK